AVSDAPLDLRVGRDDASSPLRVAQAIHSGGGVTYRKLPPSILNGWRGLNRFIRLTLTDASGRTLRWSLTFCPNSYSRERVNGDGPASSVFPTYCSSHPFALGEVWGIDAEWAVDPLQSFHVDVPDGTYLARVAIPRGYQELFGIPNHSASAAVKVTVETIHRSGSS